MAAQGKGKKAASELERLWAKGPDPLLAAAYRALIPGETALDWARRAETLVQSNPDDLESRLTLAEASLGAELWGRARNRLGGLTSEKYPPTIRARAARLMKTKKLREARLAAKKQEAEAKIKKPRRA